jgi:hypothetical protein
MADRWARRADGGGSCGRPDLDDLVDFIRET